MTTIVVQFSMTTYVNRPAGADRFTSINAHVMNWGTEQTALTELYNGDSASGKALARMKADAFLDLVKMLSPEATVEVHYKDEEWDVTEQKLVSESSLPF